MKCGRTSTVLNTIHSPSSENAQIYGQPGNGTPRAIVSMVTYCKCILLCLVSLGVAVNGQSVGDFAGEWNCRHGGKTIMKISITKGSPMKLSLLAAPFHIGESGEIDKVEGELDIEEVLIEYKLEKGKLKSKTRTESGSFTEYEIKLGEKAEAFLSITIVGAPDFVKPLRLFRT